MFLENSQPVLRVRLSPQAATLTTMAAATHTVPKRRPLFIANIFPFIELNFYSTSLSKQGFYFFMVLVFTSVHGYNKSVIRSANIHYARSPSGEQTIPIEKSCYHSERTKQNGDLEYDRYKVRHCQSWFASDVHWPIVSHRVIKERYPQNRTCRPKSESCDRQARRSDSKFCLNTVDRHWRKAIVNRYVVLLQFVNPIHQIIGIGEAAKDIFCIPHYCLISNSLISSSVTESYFELNACLKCSTCSGGKWPS